ncbi:MAG: hypothetical protein ISQ32_03140 [Rickettsiales bacterium]|nr:hypothetical protein [Rickettsiales bacterium]
MNLLNKIILLFYLSAYFSYAAYEDDINVNLNLNAAVAAGISLSDDVMTFGNIVAGDVISASQDVILTGEDNKTFSCFVSGQENTNDFLLFSNSVTVTVSFESCEANSSGNTQIINVTSSQFPSSIIPDTSDSIIVNLVLSYNNEAITDYL